MSLITWNPSDNNGILSNNNLTWSKPTTGDGASRATIGKSTGKWYFEGLMNTTDASLSLCDKSYGLSWKSIIGYSSSGAKIQNGISVASYFPTLPTNGIVGISIDCDAKSVEFYFNGVRFNETFHYSSQELIFPKVSRWGANPQLTINFGATEFSYQIPNGYKPYDLESAKSTWLVTTIKHLIKSNNNILTLQNNEFVQVSDTSKESFETYGLDTLSGLATPSTKTKYIMNEDRVEGEGKVFSQTITPAKWQSLIQNIKLI